MDVNGNGMAGEAMEADDGQAVDVSSEDSGDVETHKRPRTMDDDKHGQEKEDNGGMDVDHKIEDDPLVVTRRDGLAEGQGPPVGGKPKAKKPMPALLKIGDTGVGAGVAASTPGVNKVGTVHIEILKLLGLLVAFWFCILQNVCQLNVYPRQNVSSPATKGLLRKMSTAVKRTNVKTSSPRKSLLSKHILHRMAPQ